MQFWKWWRLHLISCPLSLCVTSVHLKQQRVVDVDFNAFWDSVLVQAFWIVFSSPVCYGEGRNISFKRIRQGLSLWSTSSYDEFIFCKLWKSWKTLHNCFTSWAAHFVITFIHWSWYQYEQLYLCFGNSYKNVCVWAKQPAWDPSKPNNDYLQLHVCERDLCLRAVSLKQLSRLKDRIRVILCGNMTFYFFMTPPLTRAC